MNKKRFIIISVCIILVLLAVTIYFTNHKKGNEVNNQFTNLTEKNIEFISDGSILNGFKISNEKFNVGDGIGSISFDITNTSNKDFTKDTNIKLILLDRNKNKINEIVSKIEPIKKDGKNNINISIFDNYSNIVYFKIIIDKND